MANLLVSSSKYVRKFVILISILFPTMILGYAIVKQNYNIIFLLMAFCFIAIVVRSNIIPLSIVVLIIPFTEWAVEYRYLPPQIMWIPELISLLLFIKVLISRFVRKQRIKLFGIWIVLGFLLISFISLIYNGSNLVSVFLFLRVLFRYYLLFLAVINLDLDEKSMKLVNKVLIFVFIVQIPLSVIKLLVYEQGERSFGLSSHAISTIIPLIALGFLLSYYFLYKKLKIYILLITGFIAFPLIGGKRAFVFYLPVLLMFLAWFLKDNFKMMFRYVIVGIFILTLSIYASLRLIPTLNPQRVVGGSFDPSYVINYAYNYSTHLTDSGLSTGRISSSVVVFNNLYNGGFSRFLFGFGPGIIMKSMFKNYDRRDISEDEFGIRYGENGLNWLGLQVGYLGCFVFFILFYLILRKSLLYYKRETDPYWHSFSLGIAGFSFIMMVASLLYMPFFTHDAVSAFYFCLAGFLINRTNQKQQNEIKTE